MSKFKKLQSMLEHEGHSKKSAGAIAASVGRKKYGSKAMSMATKKHIPAAQAKKEMK